MATMAGGAYWRCPSLIKGGSHPSQSSSMCSWVESWPPWVLSTMATANRKYCLRWFPVCQSCFLDVWCPPSQFPPLDASRTALPVHCLHGGKRWDWPSLGLVWFVEKPCPAHLETLATDPTFTDEEIYHPSKTTWIDNTRQDCATLDSYRHEMAHKYHQVPLGWSNPESVSWP